MKKFIALLLVTLAFAQQAKAESIVVIDQNGTVTKQIYTTPTTYVSQPTVVTTQPAQTITVVRESPVVQNSYYYDSYATNAALAAGVTTAVVGGLLFHGFHGGHHHGHGRPAPAPHHGRHGGPGHGGHHR